MTPPNYRHRTNTNPYLSYGKVYQPLVPAYQRPLVAPFYQRYPPQIAHYQTPPVSSQPDTVVQNLQNILASFEDTKTAQLTRPLNIPEQHQIQGAMTLGAGTIPQLKGQGLATLGHPPNVAPQALVGGKLNYGKPPESVPAGVRGPENRQNWAVMAQSRQQVKPKIANIQTQRPGLLHVQTQPGPPQTQTKLSYRLNPPLSAPYGRISTPAQMQSTLYEQGAWKVLNKGPEKTPALAAASKTFVSPSQAYNQPFILRTQTKAPANLLMQPKLPVRFVARPKAAFAPLLPPPRRVTRPPMPGQVPPLASVVPNIQNMAPWQTLKTQTWAPKTANGLQNPAAKARIYQTAVYGSLPHPQLLPRPAPPAPAAPVPNQVSFNAYPNIYHSPRLPLKVAVQNAYAKPRIMQGVGRGRVTSTQLKIPLRTATTKKTQAPQLRYTTLSYPSLPHWTGNAQYSAPGVGSNVQSLDPNRRVIVLQPGQLIPYYKALLGKTDTSPQLLAQLQKLLARSPTHNAQIMTNKPQVGQASARTKTQGRHTRPPANTVASLWFPNDPMHVRYFTQPYKGHVTDPQARYLQRAPYAPRAPLYMQPLAYKVFYLNKRDQGMTEPQPRTSIQQYVTKALSGVLSRLGKKKRKRHTKRTATT